MTGKAMPKAKYTLLCDDIREEKNNKVTLVGLYSLKVIFNSALPALLPKLCIRICFDVSKPYIDEFNLLIRKPTQSNIGPFQVKVLPPSDESGESFLNITFSPFPADSVGPYELIAEHGEKEEMIHRFIVETTAVSPDNVTPEIH
jgi:Family of unknown function (DUF6941)